MPWRWQRRTTELFRSWFELLTEEKLRKFSSSKFIKNLLLWGRDESRNENKANFLSPRIDEAATVGFNGGERNACVFLWKDKKWRRTKEWSGKTKHSICYFSKFSLPPHLAPVIFSSPFELEKQKLLGELRAERGEKSWARKKNNKKMTENLIIFSTPPLSSSLSHFLSQLQKKGSRSPSILFISVSKKYLPTFMSWDGGLNWWDEQAAKREWI